MRTSRAPFHVSVILSCSYMHMDVLVLLVSSFRGVLIRETTEAVTSLVPRPHPQNGKGSGDIRAFSWLCCVSSHVTTTRHAYGIRHTVLYVVCRCHWLTQHNQENTRMSPDPFPFCGWGLGTRLWLSRPVWPHHYIHLWVLIVYLRISTNHNSLGCEQPSRPRCRTIIQCAGRFSANARPLQLPWGVHCTYIHVHVLLCNYTVHVHL